MWSMPRSILKVVAVIIAACAVTGLVLGFQGAPRKGRLPGESAKGESAEAQTATDVQPLIEDIAPPPEDKKAEAEKPEEVDPALATTPETPPAATPTLAKPAPKPASPEDKVGDLLDGVTPPPLDEPPH
jgi:hypothetical protein